MHSLTTSASYSLRFDLVTFERRWYHAEYSRITIAPESDRYLIQFSGYSGNAGQLLYVTRTNTTTRKLNCILYPYKAIIRGHSYLSIKQEVGSLHCRWLIHKLFVLRWKQQTVCNHRQPQISRLLLWRLVGRRMWTCSADRNLWPRNNKYLWRSVESRQRTSCLCRHEDKVELMCFRLHGVKLLRPSLISASKFLRVAARLCLFVRVPVCRSCQLGMSARYCSWINYS